jgi:cytoskeletal protein CcmA (bactofilin family)
MHNLLTAHYLAFRSQRRYRRRVCVFARIPAIVKSHTGKGNQHMALNEEFESKIGKGTKASGKLSFRGPVKIEGEAEGEINGEEVVISNGAVVSARISATKVTIAGAFSGEVTARERVELMATARVQCTINTPSLVLNEGAQFDGDCKMPEKKAA